MEDRDILHAIVQADRDARERVDAAERRVKLLSGSRDGIFAEAEKTAMAAARQETDALRSEAQKASADQIAALDKKLDETLAALDRQFEEKKPDCIERIFRAAVGLT